MRRGADKTPGVSGDRVGHSHRVRACKKARVRQVPTTPRMPCEIPGPAPGDRDRVAVLWSSREVQEVGVGKHHRPRCLLFSILLRFGSPQKQQTSPQLT